MIAFYDLMDEIGDSLQLHSSFLCVCEAIEHKLNKIWKGKKRKIRDPNYFLDHLNERKKKRVYSKRNCVLHLLLLLLDLQIIADGFGQIRYGIFGGGVGETLQFNSKNWVISGYIEKP